MRKLAAIMFTDLVGYSALAQKNEALALELLKEHQELLRPLFAQHHGTEIKTIGDAFLVEFASAVEAARCAVDIQKALTAHTSVVVPERRIQVRIGLHVGDVVIEEGDVLGDGVNIASRIEPLAAPGGICVSDAVAQQIRNKVDAQLESLGERNLKNIKEPVTVYRIVLPWEAGAVPSKGARQALRRPGGLRWIGAGAAILLLVAVVWWLTSRGATVVKPGEITSIAVLPLDNLMNDPDQDYFVDGMHEALITNLSRISALRVISRTSVMQYKKLKKPIPEIARELNVDAVVEGSVLRADGRVRITAQLIGAQPERHLWADEYDRDLRDILALHSEVAQAIAQEIKITLKPEEEARLASTRQVDPEVYQLCLQGQYHLRQSWAEEGIRKGIAYFQQAIEKDPSYAPAYAGLANGYNMLSFYIHLSPNEAYPKAKAAVMKALELDESLGDAHAALALIKFQYEWDWSGPEGGFQRALELDPGCVDARKSYAFYLTQTGRFDEAIAVTKRAMELDPFNPLISAALGWTYFVARRYDEAIGHLRKVVELAPDVLVAHLWLSWAYLMKEMYGEAIAEVEPFSSYPNPVTIASLVYAYGVSGRQDEALNLLDTLLALSTQLWLDPALVAFAYMGIGDNDQALEWAERGYRERSPSLVYFRLFPLADHLRDDTRYMALLEKMGLEP